MVNKLVDFSLAVVHPFCMRKKLFAALFPALAVLAAASGVFYFTRPVVAFVFPDVGKQYLKQLDKPKALTMHYRTVYVGVDDLDNYDNIKLIINHTGFGIEYPCEIYDVRYDTETVFRDTMSAYDPEDLVILYDRRDEAETGFAAQMSAGHPGTRTIAYDGSMQKVDYAVNGATIGEDDVLVVLDAEATAGFLRYLGKPRFIVDYLDAASMTVLEPEAVAVPDWDGIILSCLRKGKAAD